MNKLKRQFPKLYKYYKKELKKAQKCSLTDLGNILDYLYVYLRMLRDFGILFSTTTKFSDNPKIVALCVAVEQYELFLDCINNYYNVSATGIEVKDSEKSKDEILAAYQAERSQHWVNFWAVVYENMEGWLDFDALI